MPALNQLYRERKDQAAFYFVYIQEAHASDAWQVRSNERDKVIFATPRSLDERSQVAGLCRKDLKIDLPILVDGLDDGVDEAYAAWPDRMYVVDREGRVAYKSRPGPFGFEVARLAEALKPLLAPHSALSVPTPRPAAR